jgi:folate-binding protein YgfZ
VTLAHPLSVSSFKAIIKMLSLAKFQLENSEKQRKIFPMTQIDLAITTQSTALAALLHSSAKPHELAAHQLCAYRGALTTRELDAPESEIAALVSGAAVHDLGWLRLVAVRGEDRFRWLSGMVTNMVNDLAPGAGAWNLVLNAQGRIQGDLTVWRDGDNLELEIAADQYDKLIAHLDHFIIMDDVELVPLSGEAPGEAASETAIGLTGPLADEVLGRLSLPTLAEPLTGTRVEWNGLDLRIMRGYGALAPHYELWTLSAGLAKLWKYVRAAGAIPVGCASLEAFRIAEGIAAYGIDIAERDLPQETSQTRALHFNKGCYLGQEIVERIRSRGNVHRHLRQLELTGPMPVAGTELILDGATAGRITSTTELKLKNGNRVFALGMIRGESELSNRPLTYTAGTANGTARILASPPNLNPS